MLNFFTIITKKLVNPSFPKLPIVDLANSLILWYHLSNLPTLTGDPTIQLNSETIYLELVSDPSVLHNCPHFWSSCETYILLLFFFFLINIDFFFKLYFSIKEVSTTKPFASTIRKHKNYNSTNLFNWSQKKHTVHSPLVAKCISSAQHKT